jgi:hypothetical protein
MQGHVFAPPDSHAELQEFVAQRQAKQNPEEIVSSR